MNYHIYQNYRGDYSMIHHESCSEYIDHLKGSVTGKWHGPFTLEGAREYQRQELRMRYSRECLKCLPPL